MTAGQITFTVDPDLKARIKELVAEGEFRTVSDFVNEAVLLKFEIEQIPVDGGAIHTDSLARFLASPRGRRHLLEALRAAKIE